MNILAVIKDIFAPAAKLVDDLHTSEEEKLAIKAQMLGTYGRALEAGYEYSQKELETKGRVIEAEAKSEHWITSTWRPITMLTFVALVVADQTGLLAFRLADEAWGLLQLGLGGYVVGRSVEKVVPDVINALKGKEK